MFEEIPLVHKLNSISQSYEKCIAKSLIIKPLMCVCTLMHLHPHMFTVPQTDKLLEKYLIHNCKHKA